MQKVRITIDAITAYTPGQIRRLLEDISCPGVSVDWLSVTAVDEQEVEQHFSVDIADTN